MFYSFHYNSITGKHLGLVYGESKSFCLFWTPWISLSKLRKLRLHYLFDHSIHTNTEDHNNHMPVMDINWCPQFWSTFFRTSLRFPVAIPSILAARRPDSPEAWFSSQSTWTYATSSCLGWVVTQTSVVVQKNGSILPYSAWKFMWISYQ